MEASNRKLLDAYQELDESREQNEKLNQLYQQLEADQKQLVEVQIPSIEQLNNELALQNQTLKSNLNEIEEQYNALLKNSNIQRIDAPREVNNI